MVRMPAREQSHARVAAIAARTGDARQFRRAMLDEIARVIGFDAHVWLLTDPETSVGCAPLADVPAGLIPLLPRLIGLKYLTATNRWTTLTAVATLCGTTAGDPSRSRLWRELLSDHGVVDIVSCVFTDRFGCWGFLDLWRTGGEPFSEAETSYLADLADPVTVALRRCQAQTFVIERTQEPRPPGPVVLLLSPDLRVLAQTPETDEYLRLLVPPTGEEPPVPAAAYNVAAQLLAVEEGVDRNPAFARVHLFGGWWVSLRAARIGGAPVGEQNIAVTIEAASPAERVSLFGRAFGLSPREIELLGHLATGTDTRELARLMFLSEHTVQDHLKSIFAKTSAHNRRSLLSRALGT